MRGTAPLRPAPALQPWGHQLRTLVRRQLALFVADRRNLAFAALSVIVPAVALLLLVHPGALDRDSAPHRDGLLLVAAIVVAATSIGAANSLREIVKEKAVHRRERAAGLSIVAYLGSKLAVLGGITVVQSLVLTRVATLSAGGPGRAVLLPVPGIELALEVALAAVAAVALGLLLSAMVSSSEKAMALVAVVFMAEWLLSGAAVSLHDKPVLRAVAYTTSSSWGFSAASATTDLPTVTGRCGAEDLLAVLGLRDATPCDGGGSSQRVRIVLDAGALLALTAGMLGLTGLVLARQGGVPARRRRPSPGRPSDVGSRP